MGMPSFGGLPTSISGKCERRLHGKRTGTKKTPSPTFSPILRRTLAMHLPQKAGMNQPATCPSLSCGRNKASTDDGKLCRFVRVVGPSRQHAIHHAIVLCRGSRRGVPCINSARVCDTNCGAISLCESVGTLTV